MLILLRHFLSRKVNELILYFNEQYEQFRIT